MGRTSSQPLSLALCGALALQACSTTYTPPVSGATDYSSDDSVKAFIDGHITAYTKALKQLGGGKDAAAVTTILAAVGGTTALALGAGVTVGILAGSLGAGVNATEKYANPTDRLKLVGQALNATICIRDEYANQVGFARSLGYGNAGAIEMRTARLAAAQLEITNNAFLQRQIGDAGQIAIDATRTVSTNLQVKLADVSKVPDYAATVKAIQEAQKAADAGKPKDPAKVGPAAALLEQVSEYEKRIQDCKAKFPA